jgi:hypothetical protein
MVHKSSFFYPNYIFSGFISDTECDYRNKDGNQVKGYSMNITESCDDEKELNLIGSVDVREVTTADVYFFENDIKNAQKVFPDKTAYAHTDRAYHSPDNQDYYQQPRGRATEV